MEGEPADAVLHPGPPFMDLSVQTLSPLLQTVPLEEVRLSDSQERQEPSVLEQLDFFCSDSSG